MRRFMVCLLLAGFVGPALAQPQKRFAVVEAGKTRAVLDCTRIKLQATDLSVTLTCESGVITLYDESGRVAHRVEARRY